MKKKINRLKKITPLTIATLFLAISTYAQDPKDILSATFVPPQSGYIGHVTVTQWTGKKTKVDELGIEYSPPNRYRMEFFAPDGTVERIVISDGAEEQVILPKQKKVFSGMAAKVHKKQLAQKEEWELLQENYDISLSGTDVVAGRPTWIINLTSKVPGKPKQTVWVDQQTNVILETKRFHPQHSRAVQSRFTKFLNVTENDDSKFVIKSIGTGLTPHHGLDPEFLSIEDLEKSSPETKHVPQSIPDGFIFESGNVFQVNGKPVRHFRYTDGLIVLSVFQTGKPVHCPTIDPDMEDLSITPSGHLQMTGSGRLIQWKEGGKHFTLIGDISEERLENISHAFH